MKRYNRMPYADVSLTASLTPLLDVAFCLLIVMVMCSKTNYMSFFPVCYEEPGSDKASPKNALELELDRQGVLIDDQAHIHIEMLPEYLIEKGIVGPVPLVLHVDTDLDCKKLMHALGHLSSFDCVNSLCVTTNS